eukprot:TRINITY_DN7129_c0_g1_i2.p1 TRINITY_DN7129_c0_g1~~TRINITY_DN7129_c0_g1_i2.p1  ORF type:complete len:339 (-),score=67.93 TRINITY_DN7129_c0_g1_i2:843-1718(-)
MQPHPHPPAVVAEGGASRNSAAGPANGVAAGRDGPEKDSLAKIREAQEAAKKLRQEKLDRLKQGLPLVPDVRAGAGEGRQPAAPTLQQQQAAGADHKEGVAAAAVPEGGTAKGDDAGGAAATQKQAVEATWPVDDQRFDLLSGLPYTETLLTAQINAAIPPHPASTIAKKDEATCKSWSPLISLYQGKIPEEDMFWNTARWPGYGEKSGVELHWAAQGVRIFKSCPVNCTFSMNQRHVPKADAIMMEIVNHAKFFGLERIPELGSTLPPKKGKSAVAVVLLRGFIWLLVHA